MSSPDEVLPAAFALHNSPRRYALLVGSGISRDTGILTAGEITDDLIRQIDRGDGYLPVRKPRTGIKRPTRGRLRHLQGCLKNSRNRKRTGQQFSINTLNHGIKSGHQ